MYKSIPAYNEYRKSSKKTAYKTDMLGFPGTTASVCSQLNRRFITGDVSPVAVRVTADRLISKGYVEYDVKALPQTKEEYLIMGGHISLQILSVNIWAGSLILRSQMTAVLTDGQMEATHQYK